ncbi:CRISPR-associated endonuclease/helicase Cas3 [Deinococcus xinjiangensis]|uniref:CRISPR-associated endonuclease/helicase Cas3 n=1 Tax=Deinococcus xinjiangensis TaxID=457454 RepID=A0ABP9VGM9_9DEIO
MDRNESLAWYLWAKSDRNENKAKVDGRYLPVLTHLLDVAACAWEILELEPPHTLELFAQDYGLEVDAARRWVCALAGLHDLGKASPTFQALWDMAEKRPLSVERVIPRKRKDTEVPHGQITQLFLPELLECLDWMPSAALKIADAVGCHHGRRTDTQFIRKIVDDDSGSGDWDVARSVLFEKVLLGVGLDLESAPAPTLPELSAAAFMRLAGLTSFADWVGSSFEVPSQVNPLPIQDPAAYFDAAWAKAREKLEKIGWTPRKPLQDVVQAPTEMFSYISGFAPRALQTQLAELLPILQAEPTLILVEAPMGEGKTEAGLHASTWLQSKVGHRGLYIALPTMATGNAMYTRFTKFLHHAAAGRGIVPDLQLLHGGTLLNKAYQHRIERTKNPKTDPEALEEERLNVRAESWFSVRKRAGLTEYGVGTVDQALLGVLGVPHQFVRLWGLGNRVVLLDEIHAYDTYTSKLIHALITWLRSLGSSVILMSATLPASSRRELLGAWGTHEEGETKTYPRLTVAQNGVATAHHIASSREQTPITVRALGSSVEEVAQKALELAVGGGCVAVIVNTVQRAQEVFNAVRDNHAGRLRTMHQQGVKDDLCAILFHARFPANAREKREKAVLKYLGPQPYKDDDTKEADYRPRRMILIATQVAEQSLEFDADVMITDLAPIDLVLQRAGRLHRHKDNAGRRHSHQRPELWIAGLNDWPTLALEQQKWKYIYPPYLLYRSWLALQNGQTIQLPSDLDTLVQRVYGEAAWYTVNSEQETQIAEAKLTFQNKVSNEGKLGGMAHIGMPSQFFNQYPHVVPEPDGEPVHDDASDEGQEWPQTRLGEKSVRIVPVHSNGVSFYLDRDYKQAAYLKGGKLTPTQAAEIYKHSLRVSRWQVVNWAKSTTEQHGIRWTSWQNDHLLVDCIPLVLVEGRANIGGLDICLNEELGLMYLPPS